jgi:hypothetical protein
LPWRRPITRAGTAPFARVGGRGRGESGVAWAAFYTRTVMRCHQEGGGYLASLDVNPSVASVMCKKVEATRVEIPLQGSFKTFQSLRSKFARKYNIRLKDTWSVDGIGSAVGICRITRVLAKSGKSRTYVKAPKDHELVSSVGAISAGRDGAPRDGSHRIAERCQKPCKAAESRAYELIA